MWGGGTYRLGVPWGIRYNGGSGEINLKLTITLLLPAAFMSLLVAWRHTATHAYAGRRS